MAQTRHAGVGYAVDQHLCLLVGERVGIEEPDPPDSEACRVLDEHHPLEDHVGRGAVQVGDVVGARLFDVSAGQHGNRCRYVLEVLLHLLCDDDDLLEATALGSGRWEAAEHHGCVQEDR